MDRLPIINDKSPSKWIDDYIYELGDWRGDIVAKIRLLIKQTQPNVVEAWKWRGVPVWEYHGMICTVESYRNVVKLTFPKGVLLDDPKGLFDTSLNVTDRRAINFLIGDALDEDGLRGLIVSAIALNQNK